MIGAIVLVIFAIAKLGLNHDWSYIGAWFIIVLLVSAYGEYHHMLPWG